MQTHRVIAFGDGDYTVRLGMAQIIAIEEKTGHRIGAVHRHVLAGRYAKDEVEFGYSLEGDYGVKEVIEICRQGLIGGNSGFVDGRDITVSDHLATHLVRTYLEPDAGNPLLKAWDMAVAILQTCVNGYEPAQAEAQKKRASSRATKTADTAAAKSSATAS